MPQSKRHDRPSAATTPARSRSEHELSVVAPFRLDLTVCALRRLPTNVVDVLTPDGYYVHAFAGAYGPVIARVAQPRDEALRVTVDSDARDAGEHPRVVALVRRTLGVDRDLTHFSRAAAGLPWLRTLAIRLRGVKPPRYRTLWEAFVNAIVFQQVSLHAASAIARRLIVALGTPLESDGTPLYLFPTTQRLLGATDVVLRGTGLSAGKIAALRRAGEALESGALDEAMLEGRPSPDAAELLRRIKGIGPWTATVILLRGLGRLDVFPMNDSSVARNIALVAGSVPLDVSGIIEALRPQQGMLYYHLLLARLDARGEVGSPSLRAHDAPPSPHSADATYMRRCLELARRALAAGDVPVGALVVHDGRVIGEGHERTRAALDPAAHAEIEALRAACRSLGTLDLSGATLYTTVEPCVLCAYAARYVRVGRVVFGAKAGALGGVTGPYPLLTDTAAFMGAPPPALTAGVLAEDCERVLAERRTGA